MTTSTRCPEPPVERLLTVDEVAEWLQVHPHTLRKMATERQIRMVKVNRSFRFRRQDVEAYIERHATGAYDE